MKDLLLNLLLFVTALFLICTFGVFGFFFEIFFTGMRDGTKGVSKFFRTSAISLDQTGNATSGLLLSILFLKRRGEGLSFFGNEDETVSSVLGKNKLKNNLNRLGVCMDALLEFLDPGHTEKSIEHDE